MRPTKLAVYGTSLSKEGCIEGVTCDNYSGVTLEYYIDDTRTLPTVLKLTVGEARRLAVALYNKVWTGKPTYASDPSPIGYQAPAEPTSTPLGGIRTYALFAKEESGTQPRWIDAPYDTSYDAEAAAKELVKSGWQWAKVYGRWAISEVS